MSRRPIYPSRRCFLTGLAGLATLAWLPPAVSLSTEIRKRPIPASGELLPVIGMGTWRTFDVTGDPFAVADRTRVLETFLAMGGGMVDSSPMYGSSQRVIGECLTEIEGGTGLFSATKVWTLGRSLGVRQMESSRKLWGLPRIDLMQIHNMLDWETHMETLQAMKADGSIRYIGITTSHGRRHEALAQAMTQFDFDFVQFTYNVVDREAEQRLLPLAAERGIGVIVNRPFQGGDLFPDVWGKPLPAWVREIDCTNWAQFFLKFIVSHPAVTCAIPATSRVDHMKENMGAGYGRLPDAAMRQRMVRYLANI